MSFNCALDSTAIDTAIGGTQAFNAPKGDWIIDILEPARPVPTLGQIASDLRVHDAILEITTNAFQLIGLQDVSKISDLLQRGVNSLQTVQNVFQERSVFALSNCFSAVKREAFLFAKSYASFSKLIQSFSDLVSFLTAYVPTNYQLDSLDELKNIINYQAYTFSKFLGFAGEPLKLLQKYRALQLSLEMPENTDEEKKRKLIAISKTRLDLGKTVVKLAARITIGTNPELEVALTVASLITGLLNAYLIAKEL